MSGDRDPLDKVVADIGQASYRWLGRRELGIPDAAALADLTTACEWLLQQPDAERAQTAERRGARWVLGCVVVAGMVGLAGLALVMLMLQVAP